MTSTHVERLDHPDEPDVSIQVTDENLHTCLGLSHDEAEQLLDDLQGVVE